MPLVTPLTGLPRSLRDLSGRWAVQPSHILSPQPGTVPVPALERFLRLSLPDAVVTSLAKVRSRWQTQVHQFRLETRGRSTDCLLRLYTGEDTVQRCLREAGVLQGLARLGFGVPGLVCHCTDPSVLGLPFQVMVHVQGQSMAQALVQSGPGQWEGWIGRCAALLARLHALDIGEVIPASDPALSCPPALFFSRLSDQARSLFLGVYRLPEFAPVLDWMDAVLGSVRWTTPVLNHNDCHPGNIICGADGLDYLVDWTDFGVTDHRHDLGWTLMLARAYLGRAGRDAMLRAYETARGWPVEQVELFELVAALRRLHLRGLPAYAARSAIGLRRGLEMKEPLESAHLRAVYEMVPEITGLRLPVVERSLYAL